jgi:hypothetical protein
MPTELRNGNSSLGAIRLQIVESIFAQTSKNTVSIVEQASPKIYEHESIKSYGSTLSKKCEAKFKKEVKLYEPMDLNIRVEESVLEQTMQGQGTQQSDRNHLGPKIVEAIEETPINIKRAVQADLRESHFEMVHSLESGTKVMMLPSRNVEE